MLCVERYRGEGLDITFENCAPIHGSLRDNAAVGIYDAGDSAVGALDNPPAVFDCAHSGDLPVLVCTGGVSPPTIIGYDGQKLGAFADEFGVESRKNGLVAYQVGE